VDILPYAEPRDINGVKVTLHPAGHILGSSQVRLEHRGEIVVVSGDYKLQPDDTCAAFEPVQCHTFVSEATFALPIFRWDDPANVFDEINKWWHLNQQRGKASVLYCYALGKAQRILKGIDATIGPIFVHGAVQRLSNDYRQAGIILPETQLASLAPKNTDWSKSLVVAPPSAAGTSWMRRFGEYSSAFVSGWMNVRGMRRRRNVDRGFVLSDHADWTALLKATTESQAQRVLVTHGYIPMLVRFLREQGVDASGLSTRFEGEQAETEAFAAGAAREEAEQGALRHVEEDSAMETEMLAASGGASQLNPSIPSNKAVQEQ
jgi:putative mRNA 3-end processing factor